jgi:hypothetical protein
MNDNVMQIAWIHANVKNFHLIKHDNMIQITLNHAPFV